MQAVGVLTRQFEHPDEPHTARHVHGHRPPHHLLAQSQLQRHGARRRRRVLEHVLAVLLVDEAVADLLARLVRVDAKLVAAHRVDVARGIARCDVDLGGLVGDRVTQPVAVQCARRAVRLPRHHL